MIQLNYQPSMDVIKIRDGFEGPTLARLRTLSVTGVQQRDVLRAMCLYRNGGTYARIHAATQKHHCFCILSF
jgi:hypothetical protein